MRPALVENLIELYRDESGVTTVEYALIAALIVMGALVVANNLTTAETGAMTKSKGYFEGGQ